MKRRRQNRLLDEVPEPEPELEAARKTPTIQSYQGAGRPTVRFLDDRGYQGLSKNQALDQISQNQAKMARSGGIKAYPITQATGASVGGLGDPVADWVEEAINRAVTERFEALVHQQNLLIATMQEQIDELWEELRE